MTKAFGQTTCLSIWPVPSMHHKRSRSCFNLLLSVACCICSQP